MTVQKTIERATNSVQVRNVLIRNAHVKTLLYFGAANGVPPQLKNKEVEAHLYNASRQLLILKINTRGGQL
jgi:hypothetical protein